MALVESHVFEAAFWGHCTGLGVEAICPPWDTKVLYAIHCNIVLIDF